jgi:hypothetical protein
MSRVDEIIDELPAGLDRAILRILSFREGRDQAISRAELVQELLAVGYDYRRDDRPVRACINLLRKAGHMICSAGGRSGGYWMAADWSELSEYLEQEVRARRIDLAEQDRALTDAGRERWGEPSPQLQLC